MPALPLFIFIPFFASGKQCQGVAEASDWFVVSGFCLMTKPTGMSWCHSAPQGEVLILLDKNIDCIQSKNVALFMLSRLDK